jgi:hypothetical protein
LANNLIFLAPLTLAFWLIFKKAFRYYREVMYRKKLKVFRPEDSKASIVSKFTDYLISNKYGKRLLNEIALRLLLINNQSLNSNLKIAGKIVLAFFLCIPISISIISQFAELWYVNLTYCFLFCFLIFLCSNLVIVYSKLRFMAQLPDTLKIINSRYITMNNIIKVLDVSMFDFHPSIRRVMSQVSNALKRNDMAQIDNTFHLLEQVYNSEHLTILLMLIKQAHYKGGDAIKEQLESVTEDILLDIENRKDITVASRMYIFSAIIFSPFMLIIIEKFGLSALGSSSIEYYSSPQGSIFRMILILCTIFYVLLMFYLEKQS